MTWTRIGGRIGLMTLAHVAVHTGDRSLLRDVAIEARDAYIAGGRAHRREGMAVLAHAAWQRGDEVLQAAGQLAREEPGMALFTAVAGHARAILGRDPDALADAAKALSVLTRPLLHAAAAEDAGIELARANRGAEGLDQLNIAFDTSMHCGAVAEAQRVWAKSCANTGFHDASSASHARRRSPQGPRTVM